MQYVEARVKGGLPVVVECEFFRTRYGVRVEIEAICFAKPKRVVDARGIKRAIYRPLSAKAQKGIDIERLESDLRSHYRDGFPD